MGKYGLLESVFQKETEKYEKLRQLYDSREELYKNACVKVVDSDPELMERAGKYVDMIINDQLKAYGGIDGAETDDLTIEDVPEIDEDVPEIDELIPEIEDEAPVEMPVDAAEEIPVDMPEAEITVEMPEEEIPAAQDAIPTMPEPEEVPIPEEIPVDAEIPIEMEMPADIEIPADVEMPADIEIPADVEIPADIEIPAEEIPIPEEIPAEELPAE